MRTGIGISRLSLIAIAAAAASAAAMGQTDAPELELVVVTARKVAEPLMSAPVSVAVLKAEDLVAAAAHDFSGLFRSAPGFAILDHGPTGSRGGVQRMAARGISPLPGASDTVAGYFDETPLNQNDVLLMDVDRVELSRGPQGTYYGAAAMAGVYKIVPRAPVLGMTGGNLQLEGSGTRSGGSGFAGEAAFNIALGDRFAARAAVLHRSDGGFVDRLAPDGSVAQGNYNDASQDAARLSVLAQLSARNELDVVLLRQVRRADGYGAADLQTMTAGALFDEPSEAALTLASARFRHEGDAMAMTAVASFTADRRFQVNDGTRQYQAFLPPVPPVIRRQEQSFDTWSMELRAENRATGPWQWLAGAFFSTGSGNVSNLDVSNGLGSLLEALTGGPVPTGDVLFEADVPQQGHELALFGELQRSWVDGRWKAALGGRLYETNSSFRQSSTGLLGGDGTVAGAEATQSGFSPRASLSFQPTQSLMTYVSVAKGFRVGGANLPLPPGLCDADLQQLGLDRQPDEYQSDQLWNYELGVKGFVQEAALQWSLTAFHIDWRDAQQLQVLPGCGASYLSNAGKVRSDGFELEGEWQPLSGLRLGLGLAHVDARFATDDPILGIVRGESLDVSSDWQFNLRVQYEWQWMPGTRGFLMTGYQYLGKGTFGSAYPPPLADKPAFNTLNAEFGLQRDRLTISVFVENATDARPVLRPDIYPDRVQAFTLRPRQIGARVALAL